MTEAAMSAGVDAGLKQALLPFAEEVGRFSRGNEKKVVELRAGDRDAFPHELSVQHFVDAREAYLSSATEGGGWDLIAHLERQRAFSLKTFGPGARTKGVIDHIRKELGEIEADPQDISEWVDVILLALDGAWRAGWGSREIAEAITAKQTKNEARDWPDWRTADPDKAIEHDRSAEK